MGNEGASCGCGNGLFEMLTIVFIVLKLCKVITWPWLWVLSPIWIPLAVIFIVCLIAAVIS
ncbi:MAG TPA: hypothetical protein DEP23_01655 [Ruminococcaceae bacterium]|nr:hypothetical protein [Oscillospiraceae bacterium]